MRPFMNYKIIESEDGIEVVLYLDQNLSEFSDDLGTISKTNETTIKQDAVSFVKKMFPTLKVKSIKVMAGAMLLTSIGLASLPSFQASAAEPISSYTVSAGDTLYNIAQRNGTTVDAIKQANQLTSNVIHIGDTIIIPGENVSTPTQTTTYRVVSSDTLYGIASRHGTTVDAIKSANNLSSNLLQIGQTLTISSGDETTAPAPTQNKTTTHYVVSGDTLYSIAKNHNTTVDAIKNANGLSSNILNIGQKLTIPTSGTATPAPTTESSNQTTYRVVSGDTLYSIATRYGTSVNALKQTNNLTSNVLTIGQNLTIPATGTSSSAVINQEDVEWLAKMIWSEGRGEPLEGQIAIGAVIMNRVKSPLFPNTVKEVLFEKSYGYYQFTPAQTGIIHVATPNAQNKEAALRAINGEDPTNGALFFYNPQKASSPYLESRTVSTIIGNHTFSF